MVLGVGSGSGRLIDSPAERSRGARACPESQRASAPSSVVSGAEEILTIPFLNPRESTADSGVVRMAAAAGFGMQRLPHLLEARFEEEPAQEQQAGLLARIPSSRTGFSDERGHRPGR